MYRIESISVHPKDASQFEINIQDEKGTLTAFPAHEDVIVKFSLRKGLELSAEKIKAIRKEADSWNIYIQSINYLSYRMRTRLEMKRYLLKKEYTEAAIDRILNRLEGEKLLNDAEFAMAFVRTRMRLSTKGPQMVKKELNELGVKKDIIEEALQQYSMDKQLENAEKYLSKKTGSSKTRRSKREEEDRALRLLMQRGYSHEINKEVLEKLTGPTVDEEWEAVQYQGEKAMRKYRNLDKREAYQKIRQYLYRKGFSGELIQRFTEQNVRD